MLVIIETVLGFHQFKDQIVLVISNHIVKSINNETVALNKRSGEGYDGDNIWNVPMVKLRNS